MQAVFLDLDGCLIDSRAAIPRAYNHALRSLGLPEQRPESLERFIGPPLHTGFTELLEELGDDPARAHDAIAAYREVYGDIALEETAVVPGVRAMLTQLADRPLAIVTSKPAVFAAPILEHLGLADRFVGVFAPTPEAITEPKADSLRRALAAVVPSADPATTVMVGDRSHDVEAGRACGTATVGVTWGAGDRAELVGAGADRVVDVPADLPVALDDLSGS